MSTDHDFDGQQRDRSSCLRCYKPLVKGVDLYWWVKRAGMPVRAACSSKCQDGAEVEWVLGGGKEGYRARARARII